MKRLPLVLLALDLLLMVGAAAVAAKLKRTGQQLQILSVVAGLIAIGAVTFELVRRFRQPSVE